MIAWDKIKSEVSVKVRVPALVAPTFAADLEQMCQDAGYSFAIEIQMLPPEGDDDDPA
jgi:hypothetical protein